MKNSIIKAGAAIVAALLLTVAAIVPRVMADSLTNAGETMGLIMPYAEEWIPDTQKESLQESVPVQERICITVGDDFKDMISLSGTDISWLNHIIINSIAEKNKDSIMIECGITVNNGLTPVKTYILLDSDTMDAKINIPSVLGDTWIKTNISQIIEEWRKNADTGIWKKAEKELSDFFTDLDKTQYKTETEKYINNEEPRKLFRIMMEDDSQGLEKSPVYEVHIDVPQNKSEGIFSMEINRNGKLFARADRIFYKNAISDFPEMSGQEYALEAGSEKAAISLISMDGLLEGLTYAGVPSELIVSLAK